MACGLVVNAWFREKINANEKLVDDNVAPVFISTEQDERLKEGNIELERTKLKRWLEVVRRQQAGKVPTLFQTITPPVRAAILELIIKCGENGIYVTNVGNPMDIFLNGSPVIKNRNIPIILRMLQLAPDSWECVNILRDNLLAFASLLAEENDVTLRYIETMWSYKLLKSLDHMRRGSIEDKIVLSIFADVCSIYKFRYAMGNDALKNQINHWLKMYYGRMKEHNSISVQSRRTLHDWEADLFTPEKAKKIICSEDHVTSAGDLVDDSQPAATIQSEFAVRQLFSGTNTVDKHLLEQSKNYISQADPGLIEDPQSLQAEIINNPQDVNGNYPVSSSSFEFMDCDQVPSSSTLIHVDKYSCSSKKTEPAARTDGKEVDIKAKNQVAPSWSENDELKMELLRQFITFFDLPSISFSEKGLLRLLREQCTRFSDKIVNCGNIQDMCWTDFTSTFTMADKLYRQVTFSVDHNSKLTENIFSGVFLTKLASRWGSRFSGNWIV